MAMSGGLHATGDLKGQNGKQQVATASGCVRRCISRRYALEALNADGTIADAFGTPRLDVKLNAHGLAASGITGAANAQLTGPLDKLAAALTADLKDSNAQPAHVVAEALANVPKTQLRLDRLGADWRGQSATLAQPATFDLAGGVAVDRLELKAAGGTVRVAGRVLPKLALTASADQIQLDMPCAPFAPQLGADGIVDAHADLTGTIAAPFGTVTVNGKGLRVAGYSHRAWRPANSRRGRS